MIDIKEIMDLLPHRYPFLLVDKIAQFQKDTSITGIKNVTINEPFFQGHFPGNPIMPGVLIVEAMAQTACVLAYVSGAKGSDVFFLSIERAKFRKPVVPGDCLSLEIAVSQKRGKIWKFTGRAVVDEEVVSEVDFTAMITERKAS